MASQSVLELAVNTGKWDSGLKKAKTALDNFTTASGGLQQALGKDSDKMQKFVQMMGSMESKAKTAKGQMNDYKGTIEQLTMQYNRMTEAQQKTIGQDYLRAIDQLRQKYQAVNQEVQQMNRNLQQTPSTPKGGGFLSGLGGKMDGALQVFAGNLMTKAAGAIAGLGVEIAGTVAQSVQLAKEGEGIRIAFERLGRGDILDGLRQATHGTVTDIELMKAAVKFNDFKLPLDELGTMLAFAQQKAKDTGQSVDYMVDSIVTGLGRQSLMILDNLGLSASDIKERMKDTGDMTKAVGEIIREQMSKAGDYVETAAERATKADVDLKNAMDDLGRTLMPLQEAGVSMFNSWQIAAVKFLNSALKPVIEAFTTIGRMNKAYGIMGGDSAVNAQIQALAGSGNQRETYFRQLGTYRATNQRLERAISAIQAWQGGDRSEAARRAMENAKQTYGLTSLNTAPLRAALDANTKMMEEYKKKALAILEPVNEAIANPGATGGGGGKTKPAITPDPAVEGSLKDLNNQMKELRDAQANVTNTADWQNYQAQIDAVTNRIKGLKGELAAIGVGGLAKAGGVSISDGIKIPNRDGIIKKGQERIENFKAPEQPKAEKSTLGDTQKLVSGLQSVSSGLQQMGIKLPDGVQKIMSTVQGLMNIIQGVQSIIEVFSGTAVAANTTSLAGNTTALAALTGAVIANTSAISVNTVTGAIPVFANGGIVHAAGGYRVPGHHFSGDRVPAMLNSGELVLNTSQQEVVAQALQNSRTGSSDGGGGTPYVTGETILLAAGNTIRRRGQGEIVTTGMLRRLGIM